MLLEMDGWGGMVVMIERDTRSVAGLNSYTPIHLHHTPPTEEEEDEEEEFLLGDDAGYGSPSQVGFSLSMGGGHDEGFAPSSATAPAPASLSGGGHTASATTDAYFAHVVHDMLVSGYASRHAVANLLLEVKSFKFATNRSFAAVVRAAVPALLDLALDPDVVRRQAAAEEAEGGRGGGKKGGGGGGGVEAVEEVGTGAVVLSDKVALANVEAQLEYWDALLTVGCVVICLCVCVWMCQMHVDHLYVHTATRPTHTPTRMCCVTACLSAYTHH